MISSVIIAKLEAVRKGIPFLLTTQTSVDNSSGVSEQESPKSVFRDAEWTCSRRLCAAGTGTPWSIKVLASHGPLVCVDFHARAHVGAFSRESVRSIYEHVLRRI